MYRIDFQDGRKPTFGEIGVVVARRGSFFFGLRQAWGGLQGLATRPSVRTLAESRRGADAVRLLLQRDRPAVGGSDCPANRQAEAIAARPGASGSVRPV